MGSDGGQRRGMRTLGEVGERLRQPGGDLLGFARP
jgi:hypothetical protein